MKPNNILEGQTGIRYRHSSFWMVYENNSASVRMFQSLDCLAVVLNGQLVVKNEFYECLSRLR